jgi:hypothetical protein
VFIQDRLVSRSSRSLAVMIGFARSAKGGGRESLRGSPDDALHCFIFQISPRSSAANPAFHFA